VEIAIPITQTTVADPLKGKPPAADVHELAELMRSASATPAVLTATAAWLSGERRQSRYTQDGYITDLSRWVAWCQMRGQDLACVPATEADLFAAGMRAAGLQEATRARRLSAVSSWFAYLMRADAAAFNPFGEGMERPKQPEVSKTRGMSEDQLDRLLACSRERETPRTFALLTLMASTACRVSSATGAQLSGIGDDRGYRVIDLPVKGGKTKRFVMPALMVEAIDRWLAVRGPEPGPLFVTASFRPLSQPEVYRLIQRVASAAGIPQAAELSPHSIRHTVLTILHDRGYPTHVIQDLAGHADSRTTRRYDLARESLDRSPANDLGAIFASGIARHAAAFRQAAGQ
jgi:site-specific recombinase XerD